MKTPYETERALIRRLRRREQHFTIRPEVLRDWDATIAARRSREGEQKETEPGATIAAAIRNQP